MTDGRVPLSATLLRLRTDEQLVSAFRAGSDDAFRVIHDRYQGRLLAYARQMLRGSGGDAEDAMQDVFVRAFRSLRATNRPILLRAWLYRIAHNRCIDELRRPIAVPTELDGETPRGAAALTNTHDPSVVAERSEILARLVADVRTLPAPQRSVLLMREIQGMTYQELADALGVSIPAVKSLLLRARTGLVDLRLARETPCPDIHTDLVTSVDRGVRMNARARRHLRECSGCRAYHGELRSIHKGLAALAPVGPFAKLASLLGIGGGGSTAGGGAAALGTTGGAATATTTGGALGGAGLLGSATAAKVVAVVATAAVVGGATPVALQLSAGPPKPHVSFPANAGQLSATTGATVGPSSSVAAVGGAGVAAPPPGGGPASELALSSAATTGVSGVTLTTGSTGATGASGASGVSGPSGASGVSGASGPTAATGASDATSSGGTIAVAGGATSNATVTATTAPPATHGASGDTDSTGASGPTAVIARASTGTSGASAGSGASGNSGASGASAGTGAR